MLAVLFVVYCQCNSSMPWNQLIQSLYNFTKNNHEAIYHSIKKKQLMALTAKPVKREPN